MIWTRLGSMLNRSFLSREGISVAATDSASRLGGSERKSRPGIWTTFSRTRTADSLGDVGRRSWTPFDSLSAAGVG